jgi:hypothetical protein
LLYRKVACVQREVSNTVLVHSIRLIVNDVQRDASTALAADNLIRLLFDLFIHNFQQVISEPSSR